MDLDSLQSLMQAVRSYEETLYEKNLVLKDAAEACDQAMGSGFIIQKYLKSYNEGLGELSKTISLATEVRGELSEEWRRAIEFRDSLDD